MSIVSTRIRILRPPQSFAPLVLLGMTVLFLALSFAARAQTMRGPPPDDRAGRPHGPGAEHRRHGPPPPPTAELKRLLSLSDSQSKALDGIFEQQHAQMRQLHEKTRAQHEAVLNDTDARLRTLLSAQQFDTFKTWQASHRPPPPPGARPPRGPEGGHEDGPPPRF